MRQPHASPANEPTPRSPGSPTFQVARVCDELLSMQELHGGYVAVGFSQVRLELEG